MADVYQVKLVIVANVSKIILARIAKVQMKRLIIFFCLISFFVVLVRTTSSGCLSNPCTIGICYQLNKNGPAYVCICPDGTLSLSCNSSSKFSNDQTKVSFQIDLDSTRNPFDLPTIPPLATTSMASLVYHNHGKYGGSPSHSHHLPSQVSTCNPSARNICNGGQCILVDRSYYKCRCREGYTGSHCETS